MTKSEFTLVFIEQPVPSGERLVPVQLPQLGRYDGVTPNFVCLELQAAQSQWVLYWVYMDVSFPASFPSRPRRTLVPRHENGDAHLDSEVDLKQTWKAVSTRQFVTPACRSVSYPLPDGGHRGTLYVRLGKK